MSLFYFESDALHCSAALMHRPVYRVFIRCIFFLLNFKTVYIIAQKRLKCEELPWIWLHMVLNDRSLDMYVLSA